MKPKISRTCAAQNTCLCSSSSEFQRVREPERKRRGRRCSGEHLRQHLVSERGHLLDHVVRRQRLKRPAGLGDPSTQERSVASPGQEQDSPHQLDGGAPVGDPGDELRRSLPHANAHQLCRMSSAHEGKPAGRGLMGCR